MNHSFNADMVRLDIVWYKSTCSHQRRRDEGRTLELGNPRWRKRHLASEGSMFSFLCIDWPTRERGLGYVCFF